MFIMVMNDSIKEEELLGRSNKIEYDSISYYKRLDFR